MPFIGRQTVARYVQGAWNLLLVTYSWLPLIHADDARHSSRTARAVMAVVDKFPLWKCGALLVLLLLQHFDNILGYFCQGLLLLCSGLGVFFGCPTRATTGLASDFL